MDFFSNEVFDLQQYGNKGFVSDLIKWTFQKQGIVRFRDMHYRGVDSLSHETVFNVGEKIYYQVEAEQFNSESSEWEAYLSDDIQMEFVMLDPWVRATLSNKNGTSTYST